MADTPSEASSESSTPPQRDADEPDPDQSDNDQSDPDQSDTNQSDPDQSDTNQSDTDQSDEPADARAENIRSGASDAPFWLKGGELPLTDDEVIELIEFIEQTADRPFLTPPIIVAQDTESFNEGLAESLIDLEEDADNDVRSLQSLGLTTKGVGEVTEAIAALLTSPQGILGYFDPETAELYVPIDALAGGQFQALLVHELTHSLDGQYSDLTILDRLFEEAEETGDYEPVAALQAVVEGRASWVENRWRSENGASEPIPELTGPLAEIPPAFALALSVPYAFGEIYIGSKGGAATTWDLIDDPPDSSEAFIALGTEGQPIIAVPAPEAEGPILTDTVFGANDLLVWILGESLEPNPTKILPTLNAVDGWAGGRAVMWGDENESCTRIAFAADSSADLNEIEAVLQTWADEGTNRTVSSGGDIVTVTGCAPYVP